MRTLYADFNDFDADGGLPLWCNGSRSSIAALAEPLRDGEEVWLNDGELRVRAQVFWVGHPAGGYWVARAAEWAFEDAAPGS